MSFHNIVGGLDAAGFFSLVIPYMLTIAIVYGILDHMKLPQHKPTRATIAILSGFLVLPLGPTIYPFLSRLSLSAIVLAAGIITLVVIAESIGLKGAEKKHIWEEFPKVTSLILVGVGIFVFISAGGFGLIAPGGANFNFGPSVTVMFFIAVMAAGIWWITKEKK